MSGKAVGWAMEQRTGSPVTKLVLLKLADNANEWDAWPGLQLISEDTELSERTVRQHLRKLEEMGLVKSTERFEGGVQISTIYHLCSEGWIPRYERKQNSRRGGGAGRAPLGHVVPGVGQDTSGGGAGDAPGVGQDVPPNPYTKPLVEPSLGAQARDPEREKSTLELEKTTPSRKDRWPEVWAALRRWPGLPPSTSEDDAFREWTAVLALPDAPTAGEMIVCADRHGDWLSAENARRRKDDPYRTPHPHTWLRKGGWRSLLTELRNAARDGATRLDAIAALQARLGSGLAILHRAKITDPQILGWFDDALFEEGPPPRFKMGKAAAANWARTNFSDRLDRAAGMHVVIEGPRA